MDVFSLVRVALRRWYVLLPLLAIVAITCIVQHNRAKATYTQTAQLLISGQTTRPSAADAAALATNPLGGAATALTVLTTRLNTQRFVTSMSAPGTVLVASSSTRAPLLVLTSSGDSASSVSEVLSRATAAAPGELATLQTSLGTDKAVAYRLNPLNADLAPAESYPSRTRSVVITAIVGVVAAFLLVDVLDVLLKRRRSGEHRADDDTFMNVDDPRPATLVGELSPARPVAAVEATAPNGRSPEVLDGRKPLAGSTALHADGRSLPAGSDTFAAPLPRPRGRRRVPGSRVP